MSTCEFQAVWNNSGWLADSVTIYPSKPNKKTFENQREEMLNQQKQAPEEIKDDYDFSKFKQDDKMNGGTVTLDREDLEKFQQRVKQPDVGEVEKVKDRMRNTIKNRDKPIFDKYSSIEPLEHQEMNLDHEYWAKKFLYPFALDPSQIKYNDLPVVGATIGANTSQGNLNNRNKGLTENLDILDTKRFLYPLSHLDQKKEYYDDITKPIFIQKEEIIKDMFGFSREFPIKVIPHVTEQGEIVDILHNYKRPKHNKI